MSFSIGRTVQINRNGFITLGLLFCITVFIFYAFNYSDNINIIWNSKKSNVKLNEFINLKDLLSASIDAAQRGGVKVVEVRENASLLKEKSKGKTLEGVNDPVTDGDMKSHIEMYYSLKNLFPRITVNGSNVAAANINRIELESLANIDDEYVKAADIQIWIDPLDATQEYTENLKQYVTTMVCVAVKGIPTIGVIHKPFEGLTSWAWVDRAHNPLLKVSEDETTDPTGSVKVIVSRSHKGEVVSKAQKAFGDVSVTSAGGAGEMFIFLVS
ncbi:putative inositol monophosphatase 3 [Armadillidium vulgare]|nr:putative inositol monophosphatase 3 [Armadillidium vulgare]